MLDLCKLMWWAFAGLFRSRAVLEAELLVLRHQLNVLHRKSPRRLTFSNIDRLVFAGVYALAPDILDALKIVKPETVLRWHRAGFRAYWRRRSGPRGGRLRHGALRHLLQRRRAAALRPRHALPAFVLVSGVQGNI